MIDGFLILTHVAAWLSGVFLTLGVLMRRAR